ncbi:MAG: serine/threonine protein kinase, partial [Planctomycetes bacterium]|nr:serine/threonine protein kinase [Planctomycetota bacterium]
MTTDRGACESSAAPGTEAEELFLAAVDAAADGELPDIDRLVADHPALATKLREIEASYRRACAALGPPEVGANDLPEIAPRYQVRREIASGGMGTVLEVWDTELRRLLAMKLVRSRGRGSRPDDWGSRQRRLRNEARMLGQLVHPGILPLHDVGETATGDVWFTMQLVAGSHLGTLIERCHDGDAEWTTPRLLGVVLRVCEAMAYAHSRGVLHRDLKPDNVMVGPFGETYVLDWGLARVLGEEGSDLASGATPRVDVETLGAGSGAVAVGTPSYMPP